MIADLTRWIMHMMADHGPATVFIGVIIESIIIPIPSPLIIMGAGALLLEPGLSAWGVLPPLLAKVILPGALASTLGAFFAFALGYFGGKPLIDRYQRFLGFNWDDVLRFEQRLVKQAWLMIFLLRALPIVPLSLVSAAAGGLRLPWLGFTLATLAGSIPRCLILGYLGYFTRDSYEGLAGRMNRAESFVSAGIVLGAMTLILWLRRRMQRS